MLFVVSGGYARFVSAFKSISDMLNRRKKKYLDLIFGLIDGNTEGLKLLGNVLNLS